MIIDKSKADSLTVISYIYLLLPLLVFSVFYCNYYVAAAVLLTTVFLVVFYFRRHDIRTLRFRVTREVVICLIVAAIWCFFGGQGGFWYQSTDWDARNAIFRDLITHVWPVVYEGKDTALSYYIGHWLVPAAVAKAALYTLGASAAWLVGKIALYLWTMLGVTLVFLHVARRIQVRGVRSLLKMLVILVFFSGLDIVSAAWTCKIPYCFSEEVLHLEWWSLLQISSLTTCLFWVFNQTIGPWLAMMLYLEQEDANNDMLLIAGAFMAGPFPAIGLLVFMLLRRMIQLIMRIVRKEKIGSWFRAVFSLRNILAIGTMLLPVALYYMSNGAFANIGDSGTKRPLFGLPGDGITLEQTIVFLIMDAGIYLILFFKDHHRETDYWAAFLTLMLSPFIHVGGAYDFTMRSTIPAVLLLAIYAAERMTHPLPEKAGRWDRFCVRALTVCLIIGSCTPLTEFYRGFYHVKTEKRIGLADDQTISLENTEPSINFESFGYESQLFYRYVAK